MSVILAQYRLTIFGPKSADASEATVLTPIAGAAHSDSFQVTTEVGGAVGWKPYLCVPKGRFGRLDPLLHKTSIGEFTVDVQDAIVSSNTVRWVTSFVGNTKGRNRFKGLLVKIQERLTVDGSAGSWVDYFIGRIDRTEKRNPSAVGPVWRFTVASERKDETRNVFTGPPHDSVTYAYPCRLLPLGLHDRGDGKGWGGNIATPVARGTIDTFTAAGTGITYARVAVDEGVAHTNLLRITEALAESLDRREIHPEATSFPYNITPNVRCRIKRLDTNAEGDFWLATVPHPKGEKGYDGISVSPLYHDDKGRVTTFGLLPIASTSVREHPYKYMAIPPDGTSVEWHLYRAGAPTKSTPLFLDDVDPLTLWKDLLDGKFSDLWREDPPGSALPGDVKFRAIRSNSSAFSALAGAFPKVRGLIYEAADLNVWLERFVLRAIHAVARINGSGEVEPADIRIPSDPTAIATTITNADYIQNDADGPEWKYGTDVITVVSVTWREIAQLPSLEIPNEGVPLDLSPFGWLRVTDQTPFTFASELLVDALPRVEQIEGVMLPAIYGGTQGVNWYSAATEQAVREYLSFFGTGGTYLDLPCRRTSNTDVRPGQYVKVTVTAQPNPASNQLGGTRVMLVLDRYEREDGSRFLELLDAGPDTVSVVPTVGSYVANSADAKHAVDLPVTLNALGDPIEIWVNVTTTAVGTRPADGHAGWALAKVVTASGTYTIAGLPPNMRVWARVRSRAVGKLPSAWAYPSTPYVATTGLSAPSSLSATPSGTSIVLTWTNAEARAGVMPFLNGSAVLKRALKAGTTRYVFDELDPGTLYTVGVRHEDEAGGTSSLTTTTATTGAATDLEPPRRLQILQGRAAGNSPSLAREDAIIGYGLKLRWHLPYLHTVTRVQVSTVVNFATILVERVFPEGVSIANLELPFDSGLLYVRAQFERDGYNVSGYSAIASAYPTAVVASEDVDLFPSGFAFLSVDGDGFVYLNIGTDDPDTDVAYYEYAIGISGTPFPTVDETDTAVLRADMPARIPLGINPIQVTERYVVTVRFRGGSNWGATVYDESSLSAVGAVAGTIAGRADVQAALELSGNDLNLRVTRKAPGATAGFGYAHQTTAAPLPAFVDSTLVFFSTDPEDEELIALPDLADDATAYVDVWAFGFPPTGSAPGSVGAVGFKKRLQIINTPGAPRLDIDIRGSRRYAGRYEAYVTIRDEADLGGQLEIWTQNSIFLGEQPELNGLRFTAAAATDVFQIRDLAGAVTTHSFVNGQEVRLAEEPGGLSLPTGVSALTAYYARDCNQGAGTLKLAATVGGAAINITADGDGAIDGAPNATLAIVSTPVTVGPNDSLFLGNLIANDVDGIVIQFRFTNSAAANSGRQRVTVPPQVLTLDEFGRLNGAALITNLDPDTTTVTTGTPTPPTTIGGAAGNAQNSGGNIFPPDWYAKHGLSHPAMTSGTDYGSAATNGLAPFWGKKMSCSADVNFGTMGAMIRLKCVFDDGDAGTVNATYYSDIWEVVDIDGLGNMGFRNKITGQEVTADGTNMRLYIDNMTFPAGALRCILYEDVVYTPSAFPPWINFPSLTVGAGARNYADDPTGGFVANTVGDVVGAALQRSLEANAVSGVQSGTQNTAVVAADVYTGDMLTRIIQAANMTVENAILDRLGVLQEDENNQLREIENRWNSAVQAMESIGFALYSMIEQMQRQLSLIGPMGDAGTAQNMYDATGALQVYDSYAQRFDNVRNIDGETTLLLGAATVSDGLGPRRIVKGRIVSQCKGGSVSGSSWTNGDAIVYDVLLQGTPDVRPTATGGRTMEWRRSMWTGPFDPALPVWIERVALNPGAGGFTPCCRFAQTRGTLTSRTDTFAANNLDTIGETISVNIANAPAFDQKYTTGIHVVLHSDSTGLPPIVEPRAGVTVAIDVDDGGGMEERFRFTETITGDSDLDFIYSIPLDIAGLVAGDDFQVRIVDIELLGGSSYAQCEATSVTYRTSSAATIYASMTPDQATNPNDRIPFISESTT